MKVTNLQITLSISSENDSFDFFHSKKERGFFRTKGSIITRERERERETARGEASVLLILNEEPIGTPTGLENREPGTGCFREASETEL